MHLTSPSSRRNQDILHEPPPLSARRRDWAERAVLGEEEMLFHHSPPPCGPVTAQDFPAGGSCLQESPCERTPAEEAEAASHSLR